MGVTLQEALPRFGQWLCLTRNLQREVYGVEPAELDHQEWLAYMRWNFLAAHTELGEALQSLRWKPWKSDTDTPPTNEEREAALEELVDVLHFIGNILCALDISTHELNVAYARKAGVNAERQRDGY